MDKLGRVAGIPAVLTCTMPTMSAATAWVLMGERPEPRTAAALLVGGACAAIGAAVLGESWPAEVLGAMALVGDRPTVADFLGFALVLGGAALVVLKARPDF